MEIRICRDGAEIGLEAYSEIRALLLRKPDATLGLATGSTPLPLYDAMAADREASGISYRLVRTFNLDEYVGLEKTHPESYISFMTRHLFSRLDIDMARVSIPDGLAPDLDAECARYSALLESATIDAQVLGIGKNGHIAFNEPGSPFGSKTRVVRLTPSTVLANSRFFASLDEVPKRALTMGISEIMRAKRIFLLASGAGKAEAIRAALSGPVAESCPASVLQTHPDVVAFVDRDAAKLLD